MSEYQYYEFQNIDRRLDEAEMQELRGYSSRARITPTSFTNEYSFGSFKGNANAWMEKYFDAYLYLANWGTRELQLRVPARLLSLERARPYCQGDAASVRERSGNVIFTFCSNEEPDGEWVEGGGILSSILPLRNDLVRGDLRALYIGWLLSLQEGELDDNSIEPSVPPDLGHLTPSLSNLVDFLRLDPDLLAVAAEASPARAMKSADHATIAAWISALPVEAKNKTLLRLMEGKDTHIGIELLAQFTRSQAEKMPSTEQQPRTVGQLQRAAKAYAEKRHSTEARKAAREKAERERLAAIAREKHLDSVAVRASGLWIEIESLIVAKQTKSYDLALQHLVDLRDLAKRHPNDNDFQRRVAALREAHARKPSFITRLREKGM